MGSVLLGILKAFGILLLVLLGLVILVLVLVLAVPFRYEIEARFEEKKVRAKARASWLLRAVSVLLHWKENRGLLRLRLLGKTLKAKKLGKWPGEKKAKKKEKDTEETEEKPSGPAQTVQEMAWQVPEETVLSVETVEPKTEEKPAAPESPYSGAPDHVWQPEAPEEDSSEKTDGEEDGEAFPDKLERWRKAAVEFCEDEKNRGAVSLIGRQLRRIGRHFLPTLFRIEGRLGLKDPARTGRLLGKIYAFYPVYGDSIRLEGVYDREETTLYLHMKGRIRLGIFVGAALRLLLNRRIRQWIRTLLKKSKHQEEEDGTAGTGTVQEAA